MRHAHFITFVALIVATPLSGCRGEQRVAHEDVAVRP